MIMRIYIVSVMVVALLAAMFYHLFKIAAKPDEDKDRSAPLLLASAAIALCADALTGSKPVLLLMLGVPSTISCAACKISCDRCKLEAKSLVEPAGIYPMGFCVPDFIIPETVSLKVPSPPQQTTRSTASA